MNAPERMSGPATGIDTGVDGRDNHPSMPAAREPGLEPRRRWGLKAVLGVSLALCLVLNLVLVLAFTPAQLVGIAQAVASIKPYGVAAQAGVIVLIGLRWVSIVAWLQRKGWVPEHEWAAMIALRPKVMAFLVAYWLLLPVGPYTLWRWISGA